MNPYESPQTVSKPRERKSRSNNSGYDNLEAFNFALSANLLAMFCISLIEIASQSPASHIYGMMTLAVAVVLLLSTALLNFLRSRR